MTPPPPNEPTPNPTGPDAIWAPWRLEYLETIDENPKPTGPRAPGGCFLEQYWTHPENDEANHVIERDASGMILLNAFPYSNGHLLVALGEGRPRLLDYSPVQRAALWALVDRAADLVERALGPQGINIGINQGRAAGAGIPGHLHVHLVPRWGGDVNFISVVGQIRVVPGSLEAMARRYRAVLEQDAGKTDP